MRSFVLNSHPNVRNSNANSRSAILTCSQCLICCERSHAKGMIFNMADVKVEWSTELVETLIENVRLNQVVWDLSHPSYKSKNAQEAAWIEIARECGLQERPCSVKAKWRDLRDTFRTKMKLLTPKSGDSGGVRKVNWQWMRPMSFLKGSSPVETPTTSNFIAIDEEECSQQSLSNSAEANGDSHGKAFGEIQGDALGLYCPSPVDPSSCYSTPKGPNSSGRKRKQDQLNKVDMAILDELKRDHEDDEDSYFMKSLIPQLKRLNPRSKAFAKCQIQQLLFEAEFGTAFEPH